MSLTPSQLSILASKIKEMGVEMSPELMEDIKDAWEHMSKIIELEVKEEALMALEGCLITPSFPVGKSKFESRLFNKLKSLS